MQKKLSKKTIPHIILVILLSLIAYSNTFHSSFHFDDKPVIINDPIIRDFGYFSEPSKARVFKGHFEYTSFKSRYVGYLTFALNYKIHGLNVAGYHLLNLLIHIGTAILLYLFILLTFKTPFLNKSPVKEYSAYIALFSSLLFACHPIQTQAVTYIWQRVTSLAAMFYLSSVVMYIMFGVSEKGQKIFTIRSFLWYFGSILFAVAAMKTKEIAFTLPVIILLYEFIFFEGALTRRALYLLPFLLTMLIIPLTLIGFDITAGDLISDVSMATKEVETVSRLDYFLTETRVLMTYLRLIFFPVNQNLDYDYPFYTSLFIPQVFLSILFLVSLIFLGGYLFYRRRNTVSETRLISFGIFWFFVTLSVESSFIPIRDVIFEHRMYLPSAGVFTALVTALFIFVYKSGENRGLAVKSAVVLLTAAVMALTAATYARNMVWKDEVTLWKDVVRKSPDKARGHNNLGDAYYSLRLINEAVKEFQTAIKLNPSHAKAHNNLGIVYQSQNLEDKALEQFRLASKADPDFAEAYFNIGGIYQSRGLIDLAIEEYLKAVKLQPAPEQHNNLGNAYLSKGLIEKAVEHYHAAISLSPNFADPYNNLGIVYQYNYKDKLDDAIELYIKALKLNPDYPEAHYNLGAAYQSRGFYDMAIEHYLSAVKLKPDYLKAHNNLGIVYQYYAKGKLDEAVEHYMTALSLKPDSPDPHINLGNAYQSKGLLDKAIEHYMAAVRLNPDIPEAHYNLGVAYKSKGLTEKAVEEYNAALKIRPDWAIPHYELGSIALDKGDTKKAKRELEKTLRIDPSHNEARRLLDSLNGQ